MTIVEATDGIIVIDPLMTVETAGAGLSLYYRYKASRQQAMPKLAAAICTHSHVDHFGGLGALFKFNRTADFKIYAPLGF